MPVTITLVNASHLTHDEEESARDMIVDYLALMGIKGVVLDDTSTRFQLDPSEITSDMVDAGTVELPLDLPPEVGGRSFTHREMYGTQVKPRMEAVAVSIVAQLKEKDVLRDMKNELMWEYESQPWDLMFDDHIFAADGDVFLGCVGWETDGQLLTFAHNALLPPAPAAEDTPEMSA
jgi:hypothetical protein